jgi:filamentous hemagglutinin
MIPPAAGAEAASAVWEIPVFVRGKYFDAMFRDGSLHPLSRTIDNFDEAGIATSIKSIDLNAATYQDFGRLNSKLNNYIDSLDAYRGTDWGGDEIDDSAITGRALSLIIPKGSMTSVQKSAIEAARARAKSLGIDVIITEF